MIEERLRPPANSKSPEAVGLGPFQDLSKFRPVSDFLEGQPLDRSTGDDQSIKEIVPDILEPAIETSQIPRFGMARRV